MAHKSEQMPTQLLHGYIIPGYKQMGQRHH